MFHALGTMIIDWPVNHFPVSSPIIDFHVKAIIREHDAHTPARETERVKARRLQIKKLKKNFFFYLAEQNVSNRKYEPAVKRVAE